MRLKLGPCGSVTQATSKSTGVTCEGVGGVITMNAASLAATTSVGFTVTNSLCGGRRYGPAQHGVGRHCPVLRLLRGCGGCGIVQVIHLRNVTAGALAEAVVLNFSIIKNNI
jgi:hypothetical protein